MLKTKNNLPMILIILDGWGIAKPNKGNAIALAKTPNMDSWAKEYPYIEIKAAGPYVGLPPGQVGNSEAGHTNLGAGRIVDQEIMKISKSINNGLFFKNPAFKEAISFVKKNQSRLHLLGLLSSNQSPHSDPDHLLALITLARENGLQNTAIHIITDGRDSPRYAALKLVEDLERKYLKEETIATVMGRFYAMDRKKMWARTQKAYNAMVLSEGLKVESAQTAINQSYNKGETDEFIEPYIIVREKEKPLSIKDNDAVIFFNLRSDRARQLSKVFVQKKFMEMNPGSFKPKKKLKNVKFVAMTDFGPDLDSILSAFPSLDLKNTLPMVLSDLRQLYMAETEKYAHVTYFFNGGYSDPVAGEHRKLIPSPDVKAYDQAPEMSSKKLAKEVINNLKEGKCDFTVLNFAAPDMIGHTGNLKAAIYGCERVDYYAGKIVEEYLKKGGMAIITADHGNAEEMINLETDEIITEHSASPAPFIIIGRDFKNKKIKLLKDGILADVAPTILKLLGYKKPKEMTGRALC